MELGAKRDNTLDASTELLLGRRRAITALGAAVSVRRRRLWPSSIPSRSSAVGADQIPITIVPFGAEDRFAQHVSEIVSADLNRSGRFKLQDIGSVRPLPAEPAEVNFRYWKNRGNQTLVVGRVQARNDGRLEVSFRMIDTVKEAQMVGYCPTIASAQLRVSPTDRRHHLREAHRRAGVFSTRIAYVARNPDRFRAAGGRRRWCELAVHPGAPGARHLPGVVARWHAHRLRLLRSRQAHRLPAHLTNGRGAYWPTSRASTARRRGTRTGDGSGHAVHGRASADLPHQCRGHRCRTR